MIITLLSSIHMYHYVMLEYYSVHLVIIHIYSQTQSKNHNPKAIGPMVSDFILFFHLILFYFFHLNIDKST